MVVPGKLSRQYFDVLMFPLLENRNRTNPKPMILVTSRHLLGRLSAALRPPRSTSHDGKIGRLGPVVFHRNWRCGVFCEKTEYSDTCPKVITVGTTLVKGCRSKVFLQWLVDP